MTHFKVIAGTLATTLMLMTPMVSQAFRVVKQGQKAPGPVLEKIDGSGQLSLADYYKQGSTVLIFWKLDSEKATLAMQDLNFLVKKFAKNGLQAVAITCPNNRGGRNSSEASGDLEELEREEAKIFLQVERIKFPVLVDSNMSTYLAFGINPLPSIAFVDKAGVLQDEMPMYSKLNGRRDMQTKIEYLVGLKKKAVVKKSTKYRPKGKAGFHLKSALKKLAAGKVERAIKFVRKAINEDPIYAKPHLVLARIYRDRQQHDLANIEYVTAIDLSPEAIDMRLEYADFCLTTGNNSDAELEFVKVLAVDPSNGDASYGLSMILWHEGKKEDAIAGFEAVIKAFTGAGGSMFDQFSKAKEIHVNLPNAYYRIADYNLEKGDQEKALEYYQLGVVEYKKIIEKLLKPTH